MSQTHTFRVNESQDKPNPPKKYKGTYRLTLEADNTVHSHCDVVGDVCFTTTELTDAQGNIWTLKPNRKVMPSRWLIHAPGGELYRQLDQKILGKLFNPLYRVGLVVLDATDNEVARVVDTKSSKADLLFGTGPNEWAVLAEEALKAKLIRLRPEGAKIQKGLLGKFKKLLEVREDGIESTSNVAFFEPPVALALLLILRRLQDLNNA